MLQGIFNPWKSCGGLTKRLQHSSIWIYSSSTQLFNIDWNHKHTRKIAISNSTQLPWKRCKSLQGAVSMNHRVKWKAGRAINISAYNQVSACIAMLLNVLFFAATWSRHIYVHCHRLWDSAGYLVHLACTNIILTFQNIHPSAKAAELGINRQNDTTWNKVVLKFLQWPHPAVIPINSFSCAIKTSSKHRALQCSAEIMDRR